MERLTYTDKEMDEIREYAPEYDCPVKAEEGTNTANFCEKVCDEFQSNCPFEQMAHKLKKYEDAEEEGLILRLPCPVGTTVYFINYHEDDDYGHYEIASGIFNYSWIDFPRKFYLTKEEAEQALKQMGEREDE